MQLRRITLFFLVSVCWVAANSGCRPAIDSSLRQQLEEAQRAFDQAKTNDEFLRVAGQYEQIVRRGVRSGAVYYNQGNAFARAGQRGRAIACYRQAKRYRPTDPMLDANLRAALANRTSVESQPLIEYLLFWQNWISYPAKFSLTLWAAGCTLTLGGMSLWSPKSIWKRLAFIGVLVTLALAGSALYDWYRFEQRQHGIVVRGEVVARKGNASSYEPAFTQPLSEGTEFVVREHRGDWVRAQMQGGQEGWLRIDDVVIY